MPRFSVVVRPATGPTFSILPGSLAAQTFDDVEVVVSDNPTHGPARDVFDRFAAPAGATLRPRARWRCTTTSSAAATRPRGEFVAVVIDKTVFILRRSNSPRGRSRRNPMSTSSPGGTRGTIRWTRPRSRREGASCPLPRPLWSRALRPGRGARAAIRERGRRGVDPVHYFRGKIVFGAYSRGLLEQFASDRPVVFIHSRRLHLDGAGVRARGRRASTSAARCSSRTTRCRSNGRHQSLDPAYARRFIEAIDPAILDALPIPGLYASQHNVVGYDLVSSAARCPAGSTPSLDIANLAAACARGSRCGRSADPDERAAQYAILEAAEARLGVVPGAAGVARRAVLAPRSPRGSASFPRSSGRSTVPTYASPLEARAGRPTAHYSLQALATRMKAVILAGGAARGSRRRPCVRPKPLVEIGGRPIIWHIMKHLRRARIDDFVVCAGLQGLPAQGVLREPRLHDSDVTFDLGSGRSTYHQQAPLPWRVTRRRHRRRHDDRRPRLAGARAPATTSRSASPTATGSADVDIARDDRVSSAHGLLATMTAVRPSARFGAVERRRRAGHVRCSRSTRRDGGRSTAGSSCVEPGCSTASRATRRSGRTTSLPRLAADGQLTAYEHDGYWQPMDTCVGARASGGALGSPAARPGRSGEGPDVLARAAGAVTGHTGFKGAWLALWLERLGADVTGIALEPPTDAEPARACRRRERRGEPVDIRDGARVAARVARVEPEVVFHLAAQSLVGRVRRPGRTRSR